MNRIDRIRRPLAASLAVALCAASSVLTVGIASPAGAAPSQAQPPECSIPLQGQGGLDAGLVWLACELELNGDAFPGFSEGTVDGGTTLDAVMAMSLNGYADSPNAVAALAAVESQAGGYFSDEGWGTGTERYAGPLAKTFLAVTLQGGDPTDFGGYDLESELRARLQTSGPDAGRFSDLSAWGDYSNGFGQALAILGLSHDDDGIPTSAIDFLLDQQCPGGGFRGDYSSPGGCSSAAEADTDYTSFALQALLASPRSQAVDAAVGEAVEWLVDRQEADGAFAGTGLTDEANANATGVAAQALRAAGRVDEANAAALWVAGVQLTSANTSGSPGASDVGAIAYDRASFEHAAVNGIDPLGRDQWRRAIPQALLSFAAGPYGAPRSAQPFDPFPSWEELVAQQYRDFAGRAPSSFETAVWVLYLDAGLREPVDVILGLSRPGVDTVDAKVLRLYNGLLNRPPTPIMQVRWARQLGDGRTLASAASEFLAAGDSPYAGLTDDAFVDELYARFHRVAPPAAAATWKLRLQQGSWTRGEVAAWFTESTKAKAVSAVDIQVFHILKAMTGATRTATYNTDRAAVHEGTSTIAAYAATILSSDAYASRFA